MSDDRSDPGQGGARAHANDDAVAVVGIGASAGGITALQALLPNLHAGNGIAYVVVQHLHPDSGSMLPEVLARVSNIPVGWAEDGTPIETDRVYVIPPDATLTIADGHLQIEKPELVRGVRAPIDTFLISLAKEQGPRCACLILSGTGSDGTIGLRAIKEHGGLTIAQREAEYDGMMRSAVATGMVDFVLPIEAIPDKLKEYFRHLDDVEQKAGGLDPRTDAVSHLSQICALLRARTGHDFSGYKDRTVARRVQRRMQVLQIEDAPKFIERLRKDPAEIDALLRDLLIGVTAFFRDPAAFAALEQKVIPHLFEGKGAEDMVRVWIPGCSTGEEAYSIAMLLRDHAQTLQDPPKLQVFASDIDDRSLQTARLGRYPAVVAQDVPAKLLERNLVREDGTYRIVGDLREICLFSSHNVLRDAPFSKLDLISCRNLLIYLEPGLQNRLIPLFHYALNESGYLFLGTSENVTRHNRLFGTVDKANRIFQRRAAPERRLPEFPLTTPEAPRDRTPSVARPGAPAETLQALAERQVMDRYAPAYVVVNADGEVQYASGRTGKYLELPAGAPRIEIFNMARRGLRPDLRAALHRASSQQQVVAQHGIAIGTNGGRQTIDLFVQPLRGGDGHEPLYLVVFQDVGAIKIEGATEADAEAEDAENVSLRQLEAELRLTRERLQTTTEELESSNEELKSSNEELSSMNEELQSVNEELETSKEELQSMNTELQTVNAELNARVEELSRANSDIANLLESTQIATVFLDRNLTVKSFTPAANDLFHLVESDAGRPIGHVRARFNGDTVQEDAQRVLRTLSTIERQVDSTDFEIRYIMRILPYRTVDNVIAGVVITFIDITRITAAEAQIDKLTHALRERVESLETLLELLPVGVFVFERDGHLRANRHGAMLLAQDEGGPALRPITVDWSLAQGERELSPEESPLQVALDTGVAVPRFEGQLKRADGRRLDVIMSATPLFDEDGTARGAIAAVVDVSARKSSEAHHQLLLNELQHRVKNIVSTISALATRMLRTTPAPEEFVPAFQGRLKAMAGVHELLSADEWTGAELGQLVETILRPVTGQQPGRVVQDGPRVVLTPSATSTLGMVLYELATNATKYGPLSGPAGEVRISWRIDPEAERLVLEWVEEGGPEPTEELKRGFGISFISRCVEYELLGQADLELPSTGLRCRLNIPFRSNVQESTAPG